MGKFDSLISSVNNIEVDETTFNKPLGSFMGPGTYKDCLISSVEMLVGKSSGKDYMKIGIENPQGETINHNVSFVGTDKKTGKDVLHFTYRDLASALVKDKLLAVKFFHQTLLRHEMFNRLVGLRLSIVVKAAKAGYDLKLDKVTNQWVMYNLETGKPWEGLELNTFDTIEEGKNYAEENKIFRGYANVGRLNYANDELLAANEEIVSSLIEGAESGDTGSDTVANIATGTSL